MQTVERRKYAFYAGDKGKLPVNLRFIRLNLPPYLTAEFELQTRTKTIKKTKGLIFYGDLKLI